jgi:hypothetical protein
VSARERGELGRAGREAKAQEEWGRGGLLGQWRGKWARERRGDGRPVGLAGPKAKWAGKASRAKSEK